MYTYKITSREEQSNGTVKVFVDFFKDGVKVASDFCIPGDRYGFDYWIKGKILAIKTKTDIQVDIPDGVEQPEPVDPVVTPPVLTQAEIDRNTWLEKYYKWVRIKTTVVDTGIVPISNTKIASMLQNLKDTLKAEYIDYI